LKRLIICLMFSCLISITPAYAQTYQQRSSPQFDFSFGVGTLIAPSASSASGNHSPQSLTGGAYVGFSGDYLFWKHFGVQGEVAWRASENRYRGFQPYRPIFYDFNAIYAPPLGKHAQLEVLGGIGALSTRYYSPIYVCDPFTFICTNYTSTNHFMGDVGAGLKLFLTRGLFIRPEVRVYFINDNVDFSSGHATRVGGSIGYSFGR